MIGPAGFMAAPKAKPEQLPDALAEVCPMCKSIPGEPCRDKQTGRNTYTHDARQRKAVRRINRAKRRRK